MSPDRHNVRIHPSASVSDEAIIGEGTAIWQQTQVREGVRIGSHCVIGKCVYVGADLIIGDNCKIENHASLHEGIELGDGVFIGPHVVLTNDKMPRAINPDGSLKSSDDWVMGHIRIERGASIGASSVVLPDVVVGSFALVGAGSVVTKDVPPHALVVGNPARVVGYVCATGYHMEPTGENGIYQCPHCNERLEVE